MLQDCLQPVAAGEEASSGGSASPWHELNSDLIALVLKSCLEQVKGDVVALRKTWAACSGVCTLWRSTAQRLRLEQNQRQQHPVVDAAAATSPGARHEERDHHHQESPVRPPGGGFASLHALFWHPMHMLVPQAPAADGPLLSAAPTPPAHLSRGVPPGKDLVRCVVLRTRLPGGKSNFTLYGNADADLGPKCFLLHAVQTGRFRPTYTLTLSRTHPSQGAFARLRADRLTRSHYTLTSLDTASRPWLKRYLQLAGLMMTDQMAAAAAAAASSAAPAPAPASRPTSRFQQQLSEVHEESQDALPGSASQQQQQQQGGSGAVDHGSAASRRQSAPGNLAGAGGAAAAEAPAARATTALERWQLDASQQHLRTTSGRTVSGRTISGRTVSGRTISGRSTNTSAPGGAAGPSSPQALGSRRRAASTSGALGDPSPRALGAGASLWRALGSWRAGGGGAAGDGVWSSREWGWEGHHSGEEEDDEDDEYEELWLSGGDEEEHEEGDGVVHPSASQRPGVPQSARVRAGGVVRLARMSPTQFTYGSGLPRRLDLQCLVPPPGHDARAALSTALTSSPRPRAEQASPPAKAPHAASGPAKASWTAWLGGRGASGRVQPQQHAVASPAAARAAPTEPLPPANGPPPAPLAPQPQAQQQQPPVPTSTTPGGGPPSGGAQALLAPVSSLARRAAALAGAWLHHPSRHLSGDGALDEQVLAGTLALAGRGGGKAHAHKRPSSPSPSGAPIEVLAAAGGAGQEAGGAAVHGAEQGGAALDASPASSASHHPAGEGAHQAPAAEAPALSPHGGGGSSQRAVSSSQCDVPVVPLGDQSDQGASSSSSSTATSPLPTPTTPPPALAPLSLASREAGPSAVASPPPPAAAPSEVQPAAPPPLLPPPAPSAAHAPAPSAPGRGVPAPPPGRLRPASSSLRRSASGRGAASHPVARPRVIGLQSKQPHWNANLRCWCLNFGGRVRLPSARNFQLCLSSPPPPQHPPHHLHHHHQGGGVHHVPAPAGAQAGAGAAPPGGGNLDPLLLLGPEHEHFSRVILQFGKVGDDAFCLDWDLSLLSPAQALAAAITSFHRSWGAS